jgi:hypothetical protein
MQQIDEIRRMSELAKQLRQHGLATNNEDAFKQAQSVTSSDPKVAAERKQQEMIEKVAFLERKSEAQQKSLESLQQKLDETRLQLLDAVKQMNTISSKLRDIESSGTANLQPVPSWPQQQTWNQPYPPQVQVQERAPATVPIDRNGVAPADVSVEKFFNFSGKRS